MSNPFFQITTRFHLLLEYVNRDATLPHVRFIWARSISKARDQALARLCPRDRISILQSECGPQRVFWGIVHGDFNQGIIAGRPWMYPNLQERGYLMKLNTLILIELGVCLDSPLLSFLLMENACPCNWSWLWGPTIQSSSAHEMAHMWMADVVNRFIVPEKKKMRLKVGRTDGQVILANLSWSGFWCRVTSLGKMYINGNGIPVKADKSELLPPHFTL